MTIRLLVCTALLSTLLSAGVTGSASLAPNRTLQRKVTIRVTLLDAEDKPRRGYVRISRDGASSIPLALNGDDYACELPQDYQVPAIAIVAWSGNSLYADLKFATGRVSHSYPLSLRPVETNPKKAEAFHASLLSLNAKVKMYNAAPEDSKGAFREHFQSDAIKELVRAYRTLEDPDGFPLKDFKKGFLKD